MLSVVAFGVEHQKGLYFHMRGKGLKVTNALAYFHESKKKF